MNSLSSFALDVQTQLGETLTGLLGVLEEALDEYVAQMLSFTITVLCSEVDLNAKSILYFRVDAPVGSKCRKNDKVPKMRQKKFKLVY